MGTILALTTGVGCAIAPSIDPDLTNSCVALQRRSDVTCSVSRSVDAAGEPGNVRLSIGFDSGQAARESADLANRVVSEFCGTAERTGENDADVVLRPAGPAAIEPRSEHRGTTVKGSQVTWMYIPCAARGRTPE